MNDTFSTTLDAYNQHASQFVKHFERKLDIKELDAFLALIQAGGNILDAGCGSARDAAYFMSKGYQALGIDVSEGLLAEAKKLHPEVKTEIMSLTDLQLPDNQFDGVWCKAALLHITRQDIPQVLAGFFRVLKPGGTLFIQTKKGKGEGTQPAPFDEKVTRLFTFFETDELSTMIESAGFDIHSQYEFNGKNRGTNSRDQDWIVIFARKNQSK